MMDAQRDAGFIVSESDGQLQPWIAPYAAAMKLADAEVDTNPGDDGAGVFTLS